MESQDQIFKLTFPELCRAIVRIPPEYVTNDTRLPYMNT